MITRGRPLQGKMPPMIDTSGISQPPELTQSPWTATTGVLSMQLLPVNTRSVNNETLFICNHIGEKQVNLVGRKKEYLCPSGFMLLTSQ